jgi:Protein of unknown function (DUF2934)
MADFTSKCLDNWVLTVNGSLEQHLEMIRTTLAKRAYELFELRGREHGLHLEDWLIAEQELVHRNLNGNGSGFCIFVDCPQDPDVTTILSVTIRSLLVFHSRATAAHNPELIAVHLLPEDIHPSQTGVDAIDGVLQVHLLKQRQRRRK